MYGITHPCEDVRSHSQITYTLNGGRGCTFNKFLKFSSHILVCKGGGGSEIHNFERALTHVVGPYRPKIDCWV